MQKMAKAEYNTTAPANLLQVVQERESTKKKPRKKKIGRRKEENGGKRYSMLDLPKDCVYKTLIKLPAESLRRASMVCKPWYDMINSSIFIKDHLRVSEMGFIFQSKSNGTNSDENGFHVEKHYLFSKVGMWNLRSHINPCEEEPNLQFMEIKDGKSMVRSLKLSSYAEVRASCNGLVLLVSKRVCGPIVINPMTREYDVFNHGTITEPLYESYGLAFSHRTGKYKVVHLFRDNLHHFGCEIIEVGSHTWRAVDGPSYGLLRQLGTSPVLSIGALHWMPGIEYSEYIVSMGIEDEKFRKIKLPTACGRYDGLVDMAGFLSFVTHNKVDRLDVWVLKDLDGGKWILKHRITIDAELSLCMVPVGYTSRNELVLKRDIVNVTLYAYDFEQREMKEIKMSEGCSPVFGSYVPHYNIIVSWKNRRVMRPEDD